jgi:hypothetical protein
MDSLAYSTPGLSTDSNDNKKIEILHLQIQLAELIGAGSSTVQACAVAATPLAPSLTLVIVSSASTQFGKDYGDWHKSGDAGFSFEG